MTGMIVWRDQARRMYDAAADWLRGLGSPGNRAEGRTKQQVSKQVGQAIRTPAGHLDHRCLSWVAIVTLAAGVSFAGDSQAGAIEQMRAFTQATKAARGEFSQRTFKTSGQVAESSSGRFAFARPGRFRWEVTRPYEQIMVADGQQVFFFDKDLNQVTVRKMDDALGATPAAILFGSPDLDQSFELAEDGDRDGLAWLVARPRSKDSGFDTIAIGLNGNLPQAMEVKDAFGRITVFQFREVERNPAIDGQQFRFVPPKGAEVVTQ